MPRETGTDCPGGLIGGEDLRPAGAEVQQPGPEVAGQAGDTGFGARDAVGMGQVDLSQSLVSSGTLMG